MGNKLRLQLHSAQELMQQNDYSSLAANCNQATMWRKQIHGGQTLTVWFHRHISKSAHAQSTSMARHSHPAFTDTHQSQHMHKAHPWPYTHILHSQTHIKVMHKAHPCPDTHPLDSHTHIKVSTCTKHIHGQILTSCICRHTLKSAHAQSTSMARHSPTGFRDTHEVSPCIKHIHGQTLTSCIHRHTSKSALAQSTSMARHSPTAFTQTHRHIKVSTYTKHIHGQTLTFCIHRHTSNSAPHPWPDTHILHSQTHQTQHMHKAHPWPDTHILHSQTHIKVSTCTKHIHGQTLTFCIHRHTSKSAHTQKHIHGQILTACIIKVSTCTKQLHGQTLTSWIHTHTSESAHAQRTSMVRHSLPGFTHTHQSQHMLQAHPWSDTHKLDS